MKINKESFKVVVLSGGFEAEREASIITGKNVYDSLLRSGYKCVVPILVDDTIIEKLQKIKPDFAFIAMFCKWGEDGIIQSLLEILGIPYSGNGVEASSICNNKFFFTKFVESLGIPVPKTILCLSQSDAMNNFDKLSIPCIVKPVYQGYSLGVTLVKRLGQLRSAVNKSFLYSSRIILQEYIEGREFTVGVLDHPKKGSIILPITEFSPKIVINDSKIKDESLKPQLVPTRLTHKEEDELSEAVRHVYKCLGCSGISRFDVRKRGNKFYFLENNTFPGVGSESYFTHQLSSAGISLGEATDYMIMAGIKREPTKLDYL